MHALIIHQAFASPREGGGTRHYEFARHLIEEGHQATVVASSVSYLTGMSVTASTKLVTREELDGIRVLRAYAMPVVHRSFAWRVVSFFSFMFTSSWAGLRAGRLDVVVGTSPPIFQAMSAWFVAALRRGTFLLEVRDLWPEFAIDMGVLTNPTMIRLSRWLEGFLYSRARHIVVNSPAYRTYLLDRGVEPDKVTLIPNGVDPALFRPQSRGNGIRREFGLADEFLVTYTGALGMANDIPTILRAAHHLRGEPTVRFLLVGDGKERANLERMARELELDNVVFGGCRAKSEIPMILAASDACVATLKNIPMFRTTYPNKVFDYMAAGRPTILGIDGVIREVIEAARGGIFVPPEDDRALADAVRLLATSPSLAREMGEHARAYVEQHFNRRLQAEQFAQLLGAFQKDCLVPTRSPSGNRDAQESVDGTGERLPRISRENSKEGLDLGSADSSK
jgi:glycosyltransferase involved in cell wall biosynthesis